MPYSMLSFICYVLYEKIARFQLFLFVTSSLMNSTTVHCRELVTKKAVVYTTKEHRKGWGA